MRLTALAASLFALSLTTSLPAHAEPEHHAAVATAEATQSSIQVSAA